MSSSNASRPRSRPRSPRTCRHITSSSDEAIRGSCRLRWPWPISCRRSFPSWPRSSRITSSRQNTRNSLGEPGACCRAVRRISSAIRPEPLTAATVRRVVTGRPQAADDLAERPQRDGGLAERRQHPLDVAHEDAGRADHEHAAGLVAAAVGVEQERRAVQRDHRLAGAGAAADRDHALGGRADRLVLLGLDGGDDRVHRPVAGPGQLGHQRALADDRQVGLGLGVEQLVLHADHRGPGAAQHPTAYDVLRLGGGGLVEHGGGRRAPVDQQRVAVRRRAARSGRCSAARGRASAAGRAARRPAPRGRRRAGRSASPPGTPSRRARPAHPRDRAARDRVPRAPALARCAPTSPAGRRRDRRRSAPRRALPPAHRLPRKVPSDPRPPVAVSPWCESTIVSGAPDSRCRTTGFGARTAAALGAGAGGPVPGSAA